MPGIKHSFVSPKSDGADPTQVQPSNWNDQHMVEDYFDLPNTAAAVPTPIAAARMFSRNRAGRATPFLVGPSGAPYPVQPSIFTTGSTIFTQGVAGFGSAWTSRNTGTGSATAPGTRATTNALSTLNRQSYSTGTTATGTAGVQSTSQVCWRGNSAGLGGFLFYARFGVEVHEAAMRYLIGLSSLNAALSADPSTVGNTVGLCKDAADTTWHVFTRDASTLNKQNTGASITVGQVLELWMFAPPNGSTITVRLNDAVTGTVITDNLVLNSNLPVNTTFLYLHAQCQSTVGTTAKTLGISRLYVETDL